MPATEPAPPAPVGLVLAAGGSRRMGRAKALLPLRGRPLLLHHLDALATCCRAARVVVGAHAAEIRAALADAHPPLPVALVDNPAWHATGMRESLLLGLSGLDPATPVVVTPVDVPPAPASLLRALLEAGPPAVPVVGGAPGHPALVAAGPARRGLAAGTLREVLAEARPVSTSWRGALENLNTPGKWARWAGDDAS